MRDKLVMIRRHTDLPVAVGFGIKDADSASAVAPLSDGVVVGSVLVSAIAEQAAAGVREPEVLLQPAVSLLAAIRSAIDSV